MEIGTLVLVYFWSFRLHEFSWHGSHRADPSRFIPNANKFTQLCRVPSQFYYNVRDVRTKNDTLITVKLMLFYELMDVNLMVRDISRWCILCCVDHEPLTLYS